MAPVVTETPRPRRADDVLELLVAEKSTAEIAKKLTLSSSTVNNHVRDLLRAHGVRNRTALVARVLRAQRDQARAELADCRADVRRRDRALAQLGRRETDRSTTDAMGEPR